jgi:hypothetical protein
MTKEKSVYQIHEEIFKQEVTGKAETKENKETSKKVSLMPVSDLHYRFDEVITGEQGQLTFKPFDFKVFDGMTQEIEKAVQDYKMIEALPKYSKEYKSGIRQDTILAVVDIKSKYKTLGLNQLKDLRKPILTTTALSQADAQLNMLKRLNNSIVFSQLIDSASVQDMVNLFEDNKDNAEIRTMLKAKVGKLAVVTKGMTQTEALHLLSAIKQYEAVITNADYFDELDSIQASIEYLFSPQNAEMYPAGLHLGFENVRQSRIFN